MKLNDIKNDKLRQQMRDDIERQIEQIRRNQQIDDRDKRLGASKPKQDKVRTLDGDAKIEAGSVAQIKRRYRVTITQCRQRLLDPDNLTASCKATLDGLVQAGLIHGDSADDIELIVQQKRARPDGD